MRASFVVLFLAACAGPAPVVEEATKNEPAVVDAPHLELRGPVTLVDHAEILYATKQLSKLDEVRRVRLNRKGELRTLSLDHVRVPTDTPYAMAISAVQRYATALGFGGLDRAALEANLAFDRALEDGAALHVRLRQLHQGIAVDDRTIDVHFVLDGTAWLTQITGSAAILDLPVNAVVGEQDAVAIALARMPADQTYATQATLRVFQAPDGVYKLAQRVDLDTADHSFNRSIFVDAATGAVLAEHDRVAQGFAKAKVFPHNSTVSERTWLPMANLTVTKVSNGATATTDKNGNHPLSGDVTFKLIGPYVEAIDEDAAAWVYNGGDEAEIELGRFDKKNSALAVFVHMNRIHDWFKATFGYSKLDKVVQAYVHIDECVFNAYAHGTAYVRFGDGCGLYDYAQNADYVFHEYTHLVTNSIVDVDYSTQNEAGAFSEGNSDYFACTALDNDVWGENPIGVFERPCNNTKRYENDYSGESHSGAPLYSGSVWELRKQFGKQVADTIAYYGMFYMPKQPMLIDTRDALIAADQEKFAGAHRDAIIAAFDKHGINDALQLFITTDNRYPKMFPFDATLTAHAQGFERGSINYAWEFSDGTTATGDEVHKRFESKPASAKVTVTDATGTSLFAEMTLKGCRAAGEPWAYAVMALLLLLRARGRRAR